MVVTAWQKTRFRRLSIAFAVIATGCAAVPIKAKDLLLPVDAPLEPVQRVEPEQARRDIEYVIFAPEQGYGGRKFLPAGVLAATIEKLRRIALSAPLSSNELCTRIDSVLVGVPDRHLMAKVVKGKGQSLCGEPRKALFAPGQVGPNVRNASDDKPWGVVEKSVGGLSIPILSITRLPHPKDPGWAGFEEKLIELIYDAPTLIIDLRGNGGGDDTTMRTVAACLFGQDAPTAVEARIISKTPATMALWTNDNTFEMARYRRSGDTAPHWLVESRSQRFEQFQRAERGELTAEVEQPIEGGVPYNPQKGIRHPAYVLIDRQCASSCESLLELLETHPQIITVGENSGGYVHFGNIGMLVLPYSHVLVQLATDFWKFRDGRYLEGTGFAPKLKVEPGKDALEVALDHWRAHRAP